MATRSVAARRDAERDHARRRGVGRGPAARSGGARRTRRGDPPRQALERHRVGARRGAGCATQLDGGAAAWAAACGSVPVAAFTITKLSWLHRTEPEAFARIARVGLPHDWLAWRLTGEWTTDRGDASGTGYWSPAEGRWRTDLLDIVDPDTDWAGRAPDGARTRRPPTGTGDNMAAALGLGLAPGDVAISLGTSGTVFAVSETPTADPSGAVAGFADATGRFLPLVCTLNATKVTDAVGTPARRRPRGARRARAGRAPPGAGGLTVLVPYLDGERTPDRPDATGVAQRAAQRRDP